MTTRRTAKRKTARTLINGGTTPVIYTDDGRALAAGERIEVESIDDTASAQIERGYLVVEGEPDEESGDHATREDPGASDPESGS